MTCAAPLATPLSLVSLRGRLATELQESFGKPPAIARAIADIAEEIYSTDGDLTTPGTILYSATHISEPAGKPLEFCQRSNVKLTLWKESDDAIPSLSSRKREVLRRTSQEAYDQDGLLTIEDCARIMMTSTRAIKYYVAEFRKTGVHLPLRGYVHSTGRGQTHKTEIICYYLEGMAFTDLQRKTYHSIGAITRYIFTFQRIVLCHVNEEMGLPDIARVVGVSPQLVEQYLQIYKRYAAEENERLALILHPAEFEEYILPLKKNAQVMV